MHSRANQTMTKTSLVFAIVALAFICVCLPSNNVLGYSAQSSVDDTQASVDLPASLAVISNPKQTVNVLENLLRSIVLSNEIEVSPRKRGLDLGMSRGFSGSQAGKHLMGLSAASFANGPGK